MTETESLISRDEVIKTIDDRFAELLATTLRAEFSTHSQMHAQDERLVEIENRLKAVREILKGGFEANANEHRAMGEKINNVIEFAEHNIRDADRRFEWVDGGFRAIWHREMLLDMERRIDTQVEWLLRVGKGDKVENWGVWEHRRGEWKALLAEWSKLAGVYWEYCGDRIDIVPPERLSGEWDEDDEMFPGIDAIMAYRTISVMNDNYLRERSMVHRALENAAFQSPSMKGPKSKAEDR